MPLIAAWADANYGQTGCTLPCYGPNRTTYAPAVSYVCGANGPATSYACVPTPYGHSYSNYICASSTNLVNGIGGIAFEVQGVRAFRLLRAPGSILGEWLPFLQTVRVVTYFGMLILSTCWFPTAHVVCSEISGGILGLLFLAQAALFIQNGYVWPGALVAGVSVANTLALVLGTLAANGYYNGTVESPSWFWASENFVNSLSWIALEALISFSSEYPIRHA